jgi:orotate phosphoribosyltransferase
VSDDLEKRMVAVSELHGDFVLSSGRRSLVYFDKFRFLTDPALLRDVAAATAALLPSDVDTLGAPEGAAMLLVAAVALETGLPIVVVRKEPKVYGTRQQVEGVVNPGARVALIEDVSTTGAQVRKAAEVLQDAGAKIAAIVLALDRGGADTLREAGYRVETVAVQRPED